MGTALEDYIVNGYLSASPHAVKMFTGHMALQGVGELLTEILENAVSAEMFSEWERGLEREQDIPVLKGDSLRLFNRGTLHMTEIRLDLATRIDNTSAYCYIGPTTLLAVGGHVHSEAYEVDVERGKVERVASMAVSRSRPGIINYQQYVFVVGGFNDQIMNAVNSAEKYGIASKSWTPLSHYLQRAKHCCSVCEHTSGLYISGYEKFGSSIEHLNPDTETFRLLKSDPNGYGYGSILCCVGDELYSIRERKMEVARLTDGVNMTFTMKATITQYDQGHYWLCCPLKVVNGELISVLNPGGRPVGLFSLKATQGQFTQVAQFTY